MAAALTSISAMASWVMRKKPLRLTPSIAVVFQGVLGERLGDEDAGIVDERVDAPGNWATASAITRFRCLGVGDAATGDGENLVAADGLIDGGDHAIVAIVVCSIERGADALRRAGNDQRPSARYPW